MKIYKVDLYKFDNNKLKYIDKVMVSKGFLRVREIATNTKLKVFNPDKKKYEKCGDNIIVPKRSFSKSSSISNFILNTSITHYARDIMNSQFIKFMKEEKNKSINTEEISENLKEVLNKKIKHLKLER